MIVGSILVMFLFDQFGELALARPALNSSVIVIGAITMRWKLRRHAWFWITMAVIVALHVLVVVLVPWTTKWVPAFVTIPIGIADLYAVLTIVSVVGRFAEGPKTGAK